MINSKNPIAYSLTIIPKFIKIREIVFKKIKPNDTILDLCCGNGYLAEYLLKSKVNFKTYHGIDIDKQSIKLAKKNFKDKKIKFSVNDISKKKTYLEKVNFIFFLDGIEHINKDIKALNFAYRSLKKNGLLVLSTPNLEGFFTKNLSSFLHDHGPMNNERDGYNPKEIINKIKKSGFKKIIILKTNFLISELIIFISKIGYALLQKNYSSQASLEKIKNSFLFKIYSNFIKIFYKPLVYLDNKLKFFSKGHCMILIGKK